MDPMIELQRQQSERRLAKQKAWDAAHTDETSKRRKGILIAWLLVVAVVLLSSWYQYRLSETKESREALTIQETLRDKFVKP